MSARTGLFIFDKDRGNLVEAKDDHEYIHLYLKMAGPSKLVEAHSALGDAYLGIHNYPSAENIFETLKEYDALDEASIGLAKIHRAKGENEKALRLLQLADKNAKSHYEQASIYYERMEIDQAIQSIEKAVLYDGFNKEYHHLRGKLYEEIYRLDQTNLSALEALLYSYQLYYEETIQQRLKRDFLSVEVEDTHFPLFLTYMLSSGNEAVAIEHIDAFLSLFPVSNSLKLEKFIHQKLAIPIELLVDLTDSSEGLHKKQQLLNEAKKLYRRLIPLLYELKTHSYLLLGERQEALDAFRQAQKFTLMSPTLSALKETLQHNPTIEMFQLTFDPDPYYSYINTLHEGIEKEMEQLKGFIFEASVNFYIEKLESMQQDLKVQLLDSTGEEVARTTEKLALLRKIKIERLFKQMLMSEQEAKQCIKTMLVETKNRLEKDYATSKESAAKHFPQNVSKLNSPMEHFKSIDLLDDNWNRKIILPAIGKKFSPKDIEEMDKVTNLWIKSEKYYALLENIIQNDPRNANVMVDSYFKTMEVWLVKLLGEISFGAKLSKKEKSYTVGQDLEFYKITDLGDYLYFIKNFHHTNRQLMNRHPLKQNRSFPSDYLLKVFTQFRNYRNQSAHKVSFTYEEAKRVRQEFYKVIVLAMDSLKLLDDAIIQRNERELRALAKEPVESN